MEKFLFSGGYATINSGTPTFHYYTQDHLGNNRAVVNESGTVEQVTHYYPFGGVFDDASTGQSLQPYKYNGKELDRMHGLDTYDYGARQYYAPAMRWDRVDPLAEKYYHISPYVYCGNNPVRLIDIDGYLPGDPFKTADAAALNFGLIYNYWSIKKNAEYTGVIYQYRNSEGENVYSYAVSGAQEKARSNYNIIDLSSMPKGIKPKTVATIHTHAAYDSRFYNNKFSDTDISSDKNNYSYSNNITAGYLTTPNGTLKKHWHDPKSNTWKILTFKGDKYKLPSDERDKTNNGNTTKKIDESIGIVKRHLIDFDKYLEERGYLK